ncbi:MAG TPA: hypothetical protein VGP68_18110, partial [Gemmataceae bacterium]|nr:hypothetical protein [Gemmataceae bacterium]
MSKGEMNYSGSNVAIDVGDKVVYGNVEGTIVYVIDTGSFSIHYPRSDWSYLGKGLGFLPRDGVLIHLDEPDED